MKSDFPVTQLTGAALGLVIGGIPNIMWCVNSAGMVVDASGKAQEKEGRDAINQCLKSLQASGDSTNSTYDQIWLSIPSYRYLGLCPQDASMVGMLMEMQAHLSFLYAGKDGKIVMHSIFELKLNCHIVSLAPPTATSSDFPAVTPRNASRPVQVKEVKEKQERNYTSIVIISESGMTFCGNRTRKMGVYLDSAGDGVPWILELTWGRKPEYYEDGEVGWSSVGAHLGALSGTFSLTEIQLTYSLSSFSNVQSTIGNSELVAVSKNMDRFRARAGDFYQCASSRHILLTSFLNDSKERFSNWIGNQDVYLKETGVVYVVLTTRHIRLQSFGDFNQDSFTGAGVTCGDDIHEDHTVTIGIGSSVCIVVVISVVGIVLNRLYDRDKELQSYEVEYCKMTSRGLLPSAPVPIRRDEMKVLSRNHTSPV
ncbi:unnamed protein product [Taenia asiatica]|uniref:Ig-like domain-containing protein n=1 Tax=Taenia asiatica TaxID=60517 RepID=A0A0R3WAA0_TAEAS|nr:unnamed protein product [Taenia asiatica]